MSVSEIAFRAARLAKGGWERLTWRRPFLYSHPNALAAESTWLDAISHSFEEIDTRVADDIIVGRLRILGIDQFNTSWPPKWNMDPKTGRQSPLGFGKHIDYRDEAIVGDIKYVWELNRHLEFPVLASAFRRTGDRKYLDALLSAWQTWMSDCPFPRGPNWCSSLECSIRLINWSLAWQLLHNSKTHKPICEFDPVFRKELAASIQQHVKFIRSYYSRFSSANNHLIGEASGILIAHRTWSKLAHNKKAIRQARTILARETIAQISSDGVTREQAIGYMPFILEFLLLAGAAMSDSDSPLPNNFWDRIGAAMNFLRATTDSAGHIANFGDNDDGAVIRLWGFDLTSRLKGLRRLASTIDQNRDRSVSDDDPAGFAHSEFDFSIGGYFALRSQSSAAGDVHCVVDCGPLGYLATAAHGHADALSMTLNVDGHRFLIDPGTFAYHTERKWRDYFRSTAAHNTVRIDGLDQSEIAGSFMWRRAATARCDTSLNSSELQRVTGSHDGYTRLADPVTHRREFTLEMNSGQLSITDELTCNSSHDVEIFWHIAPECTVEIDSDNQFRIRNQTKELTISNHSEIGLESKLFYGSELPILGWCSDRFDQKVASPTVRWRGCIDASCVSRTTISIANV